MKLNAKIATGGGIWSGLLLAMFHCSANEFPEGLRAGQIAVSQSGFPTTLVLASDGELYLWGPRVGGTAVAGDDSGYVFDRPRRVPRPVFVAHWRQVAAGESHVLALINEGELAVWGSGYHGQLGLPSAAGQSGVPVLLPRPDGVDRWQAVGALAESSHALDARGRLWVWGRNDWGQLGLGHTDQVHAPALQPLPAGVNRLVRLFPKAPQFALGDDGELYAWGGWARLTDEIPTFVQVPKPPGLNEWCDLAAGYDQVLALNEQGELFARGSNHFGQLGLPEVEHTGEFLPVPRPVGVSGWRTIAAGRRGNSAALSVEGRLYVWGQSGFRFIPQGEGDARELVEERLPSPTLLPASAARTDWQTLDAGAGYFCAVDAAGRAFTWGRQFEGWYNGLSSQTPFGRPAGAARFQRFPSPVSGFGRPYDAAAEGIHLSLEGVEADMLVLEGDALPVWIELQDPMGSVSVENFMHEWRLTGETPYPVTRYHHVRGTGERRLWVQAVTWDGRRSRGHWGGGTEQPGGPSVASPSFQVVPRDGLDPARPVVGVHARGDKLIEGHDGVVALSFARTGPLAAALELELHFTGATPGLDYALSPSVIRFAPGQRVVRAEVAARRDREAEGVEVAQIELAPSAAYQVSSLAAVSFEIHDNRAPEVVLARPYEGQVLAPGEPLEVIATAVDPDGELGVFVLLLNDRPVHAEVLEATNRFLLRWSLAGLPDGVHRLCAEATDETGDTGFSNEITFEVRSQPTPLERVRFNAAYGNVFLRVPDGRWFGWGLNWANVLNLDPAIAAVRNHEYIPQLVRPPDDGGQWENLLPSIWLSAGVPPGGGLRLIGRLNGVGQLEDPLDVERDGGLELPDSVTGWRDWFGGFGRYTGLADDHRVYRFSPSPLGTWTIQTNQLPEGASGVLDLNGWVTTDGVVRLPSYWQWPTPVDFRGLRGLKVVRTYIERRDETPVNRTVYFVLIEDGQLWQHGGDDWFGAGEESTSGLGGAPIARRISNPPGVAGWRDLQSGGDCLYAWSVDGRLFAWGGNHHGQLGLGDRQDRWALREQPFPEGVNRWVRLAAGEAFAIALGDDGRVYAWGKNEYGQLGVGRVGSLDRPTPLAWFGDLRSPAADFPAAGYTNTPPHGTLTVQSDRSLYLPLPYTLRAHVVDPDGRPVRVEFFRDGVSLGVVEPVPANGLVSWHTHTDHGGTWRFHLRITDDEGTVTDSEPLIFSHWDGPTFAPVLRAEPEPGNLREGLTYPRGFVLHRESRTNVALTVPLVISGTATPGEDYAPLPAEVHFAPGDTEVVVPLTILANGDGEALETLIIQPAPSPCAYGELDSAHCYHAYGQAMRQFRILPPPRPVIAVEVVDVLGYEGGVDNALYRLTRSVVTDRAVTVRYEVSGTLDPHTDLLDFPATFDFAPGQTELLVPVVGRRDFHVEGFERMLLKLLPGDCSGGEDSPACYERGYFAGTVYLGDGPMPELPVVQLAVTDPVAIEGTTNTSVIRVFREGNLTQTLTLDITLSGRAEPGTDFTLDPLPLTLAAGEAETWLFVTALADGETESYESIRLTLTPPPCLDTAEEAGCYRLGPTNTALVYVVEPPVLPPVPGGLAHAATPELRAVFIEQVERPAVDQVRLHIAGDPGTRFEVQTSENLARWQAADTHTNHTGRLSSEHALPPGGTRFFRLVPAGN